MSLAKVDKPKDLFELQGISLFVFNKDYTQCALSKQDSNIYIYQVTDIKKPANWKLLFTLKAHVGFVSGIDWNATTNEIVSVSYDKTSFVWTYSSGKWESQSVVATTKIGYLCCKWNSRGDKFCAGTSAKNLFIGYFNKDNDWWMCVPVKKAHHSSVTCCAIDPTSLLVISGSTDSRVCIYSCYLPKVDDSHLNAQTKEMTCEFGTTIFEFKANTWINSVCWSQNGDLGYAACQNATVAVCNWKEQTQEVVNCKHSPSNIILPKGDNAFYAVCYDRNIYEYEQKGGKYEEKRNVIAGKGGKSGPAAAPKTSNLVSDRLKNFQNLGRQDKSKLVVSTKSSNDNAHKSLIISCVIKGNMMITADVAGFIKYWDL